MPRNDSGPAPADYLKEIVAEIKKLDTYVKRLFSSPRIRVVPRPQRDDYAEVFLGDEPFGRITVDDEDEERASVAVVAPRLLEATTASSE